MVGLPSRALPGDAKKKKGGEPGSRKIEEEEGPWEAYAANEKKSACSRAKKIERGVGKGGRGGGLKRILLEGGRPG